MADRQALLKELLDLGLYDRLQRRAGQHARLAGARSEFARARLSELSGATDEAAAALEQRQAAVDDLLEACDRARPTLDLLATQLAEAESAGDAARRGAGELSAVAEPDDVAALADAHNRLVAALAEAETDDEPHRAAVERAEAALAELPPEADSARTVEAHTQLERLGHQVDRGEAAPSG